jgi:hypothetical protein
MDPNACLDLILSQKKKEEAEEHAENLLEWLDAGGFRPRRSAGTELSQAMLEAGEPEEFPLVDALQEKLNDEEGYLEAEPEGSVIIDFPGTPGVSRVGSSEVVPLEEWEGEVDPEEDDDEAVDAEALAYLDRWAEVLRQRWPTITWETDRPCYRVVGNVKMGSHYLHLEVEQDTDEDGDPEWLVAEADLGEEVQKGAVLSSTTLAEGRGMHPSDPVSAVRVAIGQVGPAARELGLHLPPEALSLVE